MNYSHDFFNGMTLFTLKGDRKYLSSDERKRFYDALSVLKCPKERFFCEMIYWTGCRPSEALALSAITIDLNEFLVIVRSLKKRGNNKGKKFRLLPLPAPFVKLLNKVYKIRKAQSKPDGGEKIRLFPFSRTKGWQLVQTVMKAAGLAGAKACARGLRHAFGVKAALSGVPVTMIQKWLGHTNLESTQIYIDLVGPEERQIAQLMWA